MYAYTCSSGTPCGQATIIRLTAPQMLSRIRAFLLDWAVENRLWRTSLYRLQENVFNCYNTIRYKPLPTFAFLVHHWLSVVLYHTQHYCTLRHLCLTWPWQREGRALAACENGSPFHPIAMEKYHMIVMWSTELSCDIRVRLNDLCKCSDSKGSVSHCAFWFLGRQYFTWHDVKRHVL